MKPKIVLDPGHGGKDPGAVSPGGIKEKDINLAVAKKLAAKLSSYADVYLTRWTDKELGNSDKEDLGARVNLANSLKADVFVSIHCNSASNPTAQGMEVYTLPGRGPADELAQAIIDAWAEVFPGRPVRGHKEANFYVLQETSMPAVLVELGFLSNPEEEKLLANEDFQVKAADALVLAIKRYCGIEVALTPIMGQSQASKEQALKWLQQKGVDLTQWGEIIDLYWKIAPKYNVRADVALAQACKETSFFRFGGLVKPEQNNFCGLGATGPGNTGASFPDKRTGVEAHIQHLYAYATTEPLPAGTIKVDPRFDLVRRGIAPWVEWLGAKENPYGVGWAYPGENYGHSIVEDYLRPMIATGEEEIMAEPWQEEIMQWGRDNLGLDTHLANDKPEKWFVVAVAQRTVELAKKEFIEELIRRLNKEVEK